MHNELTDPYAKRTRSPMGACLIPLAGAVANQNPGQQVAESLVTDTRRVGH